ncbi:MAG: hypothetical protein JWN06_3416 [Propionibacteriaceae bacterium]|jgi:hypothetical protein|nr:hypothetical protein [Propionibacteriaceae bacterium]
MITKPRPTRSGRTTTNPGWFSSEPQEKGDAEQPDFRRITQWSRCFHPRIPPASGTASAAHTVTELPGSEGCFDFQDRMGPPGNLTGSPGVATAVA